jgi:hypothetical protein
MIPTGELARLSGFLALSAVRVLPHAQSHSAPFFRVLSAKVILALVFVVM